MCYQLGAGIEFQVCVVFGPTLTELKKWANMEEFSPTPMTTQPNARTMEPVILNMVVLDRFSSLLSFHLLHSLKNTL